MLINTAMNEKTCTLTLEGSVDTLSARELTQALKTRGKVM